MAKREIIRPQLPQRVFDPVARRAFEEALDLVDLMSTYLCAPSSPNPKDEDAAKLLARAKKLLEEAA